MPAPRRPKIRPTEEDIARNTIKVMLKGRTPVNMLPLVSVSSPNQQVSLPHTDRKASIVRLAAEGLLTFGYEMDNTGEIILVAGADGWGWSWRIEQTRLWNYLDVLSKEAKRRQ